MSSSTTRMRTTEAHDADHGHAEPESLAERPRGVGYRRKLAMRSESVTLTM